MSSIKCTLCLFWETALSLNLISGNCYDAHQYGGYSLYCPFAYRLPNGTILAKVCLSEQAANENVYLALYKKELANHRPLKSQIAHSFAKDLAAEYNYLGNSSKWFYNARTKAQEIIDKNSPIYRGKWKSEAMGKMWSWEWVWYLL